MLRHLGRPKEALQVLAAAHRVDPLDVRSMAENWLASKSPEAARTLASTMTLHPATAQETAAEYLNAGLWQDGTDVLLEMTAAARDKSKIHPMAYYYLGYFAGKLGQAAKAAEYDKLAKAMPPDYVFPFQNEAIDVLRAAMKANPRDARAPYYLGNVLYDWQPEEATRMWEASAAIDPSFAIVHRNLATAYMHQKPQGDLEARDRRNGEGRGCRSQIRRCISPSSTSSTSRPGLRSKSRISWFDKNASVVAQRDDAENRAVALKVATGSYDEAIRMMTGRKFAVAEGANLNVSEHWTDAHILRAQKNIQAKRYQEALADLEAAVTIPSNLPLGAAGFGAGARNTEVAWWTGVAYEGLGDHQKAVESWTRAAQRRAAGSAPSGITRRWPSRNSGRPIRPKQFSTNLFRLERPLSSSRRPRPVPVAEEEAPVPRRRAPAWPMPTTSPASATWD